MKKLFALAVLLTVCPAIAEVAPAPTILYDEETGLEYFQDPITGEYFIIEQEVLESATTTPVLTTAPAPATVRAAVAPTTTAPRSTAASARTGGARAPAILTGRGSAATGRAVTARGTTARTAAVPARSATSRTGTITRAVNNTVRTPGEQTRAVAGSAATAAPVNAVRATSILQTETVTQPLYNPNNTDVRGVASRVSRPTTGVVITPSGTASTRSASVLPEISTPIVPEMDMDVIEELARMTDYCKAQYTQCMDQFCDVLDDNQGRCSCSANLERYYDTEEALKKITEELQNVAQQIQYIGLTADEIETIFTETEAEVEMASRTDTTQLRRDLDAIKGMIIDVNTAQAGSGDFLGLDLSGLLDFSFDSTGFDLSELFSVNGNSISNQRGTDLFKTATSRCKAAVLNTCQAQGVDINVITNTYDLEIDKQCIIYERALNDANAQMNQTVLNARNVLQRARLLVSQQKNQYDLRGCITALDECMQDEFVCGDDYENCLDPSGKYIVAGQVINGSLPGKVGGEMTDATAASKGLYLVWNYGTSPGKNAWSNGNLDGFIAEYIDDDMPITTNMVGFLQQKIGYNEDGKNYGMCVSVLNKCQEVSYTGGTNTNPKYNRANKVVENYLYRTLAMIKAEQDEVMSEYAEECIADITSCLAQNGYDPDEQSGNQNMINKAAENACSALVDTCVSVTGNTEADIIKAAGGQ